MIPIKEICYIVAACKENVEKIYISPKEKDLVIAADGGYDILKDKGLVPDIILGDFDSIKADLPCENVIKHPIEKDDTDTFLAYRLAFDRGYRNFVILGGLGGRIDHTIANFQTLTNIALAGGRGFLVGDNTIVTAITNSNIVFSPECDGIISIFSQKSDAENVTIKGLKYSAENITLKPEIPLGVSNEFIGKRAEVSVGTGTLLITWNELNESFLSKIENFVV